MDLAPTTFIRIEDTTVNVKANTISEAKLALKELKLKKKEYGILKRSVTEQQKAIHAEYTAEVRSRGSMVRGGGGLGKFVRAVQTISRDSKRAQLAADLSPLERQQQYIEAVLRSIDSAILQVEAHILKHGG
jgi:hypothetical protein